MTGTEISLTAGQIRNYLKCGLMYCLERTGTLDFIVKTKVYMATLALNDGPCLVALTPLSMYMSSHDHYVFQAQLNSLRMHSVFSGLFIKI